MEPPRGPDLVPPAAQQRVVDEDLHGLPGRHRQRDHRSGRGDAQVFGVPGGHGRKNSAPGHAATAATGRPPSACRRPSASRTAPGTAGQHGEGAERRGGEQRREHGQRRHQRRRHRRCGIREYQRKPAFVKEEAYGTPTIMDRVPQTPDPQTRNTVTQPIIAHVTARMGPAWASPRSATAARTALSPRTCPGTARPCSSSAHATRAHRTPLAIAIYKASTGQTTETDFPASFGGATGTPEQGVDETLHPLRRPESRNHVTNRSP